MTDVGFRPMADTDFDLVVRWLAEPHIARWWNIDADLPTVVAKYGPRLASGHATTMWIIEHHEAAAGVLQTYRHADYPEHDASVGVANAAGIDYFLAASHASRGVGPVMLRAATDLVFACYPDITWCFATPARENRPSWRALERAGFVRLGECQAPGEPPGYAYGRAR